MQYIYTTHTHTHSYPPPPPTHTQTYKQTQKTQRLQSKPPVLEGYQNKAESMQQNALGSYVKQQLEYAGFWPLAKLAQVCW